MQRMNASLLLVLAAVSGMFFGTRHAEALYEGRIGSLTYLADSLVRELSVRPRNLMVERDTLVAQTAHRLGLPVSLALALAWVENRRADSTAVSSAGAVGLLQVMPPNALAARGDALGAMQRRHLIVAACGPDWDLTSRQCNVLVGLRIYHEYLRAYNGDYDHALAAYNGAARWPLLAERYVTAVRTVEQRIVELQ